MTVVHFWALNEMAKIPDLELERKKMTKLSTQLLTIMIKWQLVRRIYDLFIIWIFEIWSVLPNMVVKGALPSRSVKKLKTLFREPLYQLFKQCCFSQWDCVEVINKLIKLGHLLCWLRYCAMCQSYHNLFYYYLFTKKKKNEPVSCMDCCCDRQCSCWW